MRRDSNKFLRECVSQNIDLAIWGEKYKEKYIKSNSLKHPTILSNYINTMDQKIKAPVFYDISFFEAFYRKKRG